MKENSCKKWIILIPLKILKNKNIFVCVSEMKKNHYYTLM